MNESDIQKLIIEYLKARGYHLWRTNAGYVRKNVKLSPPGTPDLIGYLPDGRFIGIEVKQPGKKPTAIQEAWHQHARDSGCVIIVATSIDDVIANLP